MPVFPVLDILSSALLVISEQGGFVNRDKSVQTGKETTADQIIEVLRNGSRNEDLKRYIKNAKQIKLWFSCKDSVPEDTDPNYWQKMKSQVSAMESDRIGLIASSVSFYNQKFTTVQYQELIKNSAYIGSLGEKNPCFIKLFTKIHKSDNNREYFIYTGMTREGNLVMFYSNQDLALVAGDCFLFRGRIAKHMPCRKYKVPLTRFNYVVFIENYGQPE